MMRLLILAMAMVVSFCGFTSRAQAGSGFEGHYKVLKITETNGLWSKFWIRPNVTQLEEIVLEESGGHLYIGLQDAQGLTWSSNYGVCTGTPGEYCNARLSADGQSLEFKFWGDWTWFVITLGPQQGKLLWESDNGPVTMSFDVVRK